MMDKILHGIVKSDKPEKVKLAIFSKILRAGQNGQQTSVLTAMLQVITYLNQMGRIFYNYIYICRR